MTQKTQYVSIGVLRTTAYGNVREHPIEYAKHYGVTCSSVFTSNGKLNMVAEVLEMKLNTSLHVADIPDWHAEVAIDGVAVGRGQVQQALEIARFKARVACGELDASLAPVRTYVTSPAESIVGIAFRELKNDARWLEIRDLNAETYPDMHQHDYYPVGTVLLMPPV
jgi:hypothetical protein